MKKYLMTGIAALAMSGLFTSCTHDMNNYVGDTTKTIKQNYENAFVEAFGQPAADQDWGFGSKTVAAARANVRGTTRAVPESPGFKDGDCPDMPTKYSNTVPEGAKYAKDYQNYQKGDVIYINTDYQTLNNPQNTEDLTIYVDGNVTYVGGTNQNGNGTTICVTQNSTLKLGSVSERLTIYLAPGATLDITQQLNWEGNPSPSQIYVWNPSKNANDIFEKHTFTFTKDNAALYMSSGSTVKAANLYFKDGYTVLNEGGTIEAEELHVENGAILYNKNEIKATGVIALRNTNGEIDNFGKMSGASMTLDANSRFYNVAGGEVNISGLTKLNNDSGNNAWMNGGQFNTGSFEITGGCQDPAAFNNCHMTVEGEFFMNHGNFVLDGGAAVEAASFKWESDNYFHMGGKALLKVTGQMLMNNQNSSPNYGFWGDDSDYAVIQAGSVEKGSEGKYRAAYYGNLFIDSNDHFGQGRSSADGPWYYFANTVKFSFNDKNNHEEGAKKATDFSISIPEDTKGCTPGYHYGDVKETVRVIAEDLTINDKNKDFDFNDIVFDVIWNQTQSKVSVKVLAAGGELTMYIGGTDTGVEGLKTVNERFADANTDKTITEKTMINTAGGRHNEYNTFEYDLDNTEWSGSEIHQIAKSILIRVMKSGELVTLSADQGKAASKICVGTDYEWCDERQDIDGKYSDRFTEYVGGAYTWNTWYK